MGIKNKLILQFAALFIFTIGFLSIEDSNLEVNDTYNLSSIPQALTNLNTPPSKPNHFASIAKQKSANPSPTTSSTPTPTSTPIPTSDPVSAPQGEVQVEKLTSSGIKGKVFIGPTCVVVTEGADCADTPFQATISIVNPDDHSPLKSFQTNELGYFKVDLAPGKYLVHPEPSGDTPYAPNQTVLVNPGEYSYVEIHYDNRVWIPPISICRPGECDPPPGYCKDFQCKIDLPNPEPTPSPTPIHNLEITSGQLTH